LVTNFVLCGKTFASKSHSFAVSTISLLIGAILSTVPTLSKKQTVIIITMQITSAYNAAVL